MTDPILVRTRAELDSIRATLTGRVGAVMTLGALHEAHREHMREARRQVGPDGHVLVTIFVNPMQFGAGEDFEKYPRTLESDLAACAEEGVDVVFAPSREEIYPTGAASVTVDPGPLGRQLEGAARPVHFGGVLTVVAKLLNLVRPDFATFGEKDYQQLALVRQMVADLNMPYEIIPIPTVREADGLALSSRNVYLLSDERELSLLLSRALFAGQAAAVGGPMKVLQVAGSVFLEADVTFPDVSVTTTASGGEEYVMSGHAGSDSRMEVDYLTLRMANLAPELRSGPARLLVAARVGTTRLLDNVHIELP